MMMEVQNTMVGELAKIVEVKERLYHFSEPTRSKSRLTACYHQRTRVRNKRQILASFLAKYYLSIINRAIMQALMKEHRVYVAVHGGAGYYGVVSEHSVKSALKRACAQALQGSLDDSQASALSIVERAIAVLEDDEYLNAGYGSNLTIDGIVECDAAVMDGLSGDFGSVGAVPGLKNPISLASALLRHSREPDSLGRIRPMTLVASGAHSFASSQGIQTVAPNEMISPRATQEWQKWKSRLDNPVDGDPGSLHQDAMQDTVGAVAWDNKGNLAAGVSRYAPRHTSNS